MNTEEEQLSPVFIIQGKLYHKMRSLLPLSDESHKFLQVYFMGNELNGNRSTLCECCWINRGIIQDLQRILHKYNQLIEIFKTGLMNTKLLFLLTRDL